MSNNSGLNKKPKESIDSRWKNIWKKRVKKIPERVTLSSLLSIDGFDTGTGILPVDSWLKFIEKNIERLGLQRSDKILEVGCGAGAFLFPLYGMGISVYGIDYSEKQIFLCTKIMGKGVFRVSEAVSLPFESNFFDTVVSNSVFQYFPDLGYAERVIVEMKRVLKNNGIIGIFDVNDFDKREAFIEARKRELGIEEYERLYGNLEQLFYPRGWFVGIADRYGFECRIEEQDIEGYINSRFRYNVFLKRRVEE